jgi:hypothetical protein
MEGTIKKTTTGYIVYGYTDLSHRFGYHGKGDKGFPQDALTACIPFCAPSAAKCYIKRHMRDDAEIIEVQYDTTYTYKTLK